MSTGRSAPAPLSRGEASFSERGVCFWSTTPQGARKQRGFTYLAFLLFIAVAGAGLAAYGELASFGAQREKEAELLFRGEQYREAIASYYRKEQRYPAKLADLLEDKRYPMPVRHLRKLYPDPITGRAWAVVEAPGDAGVMGVYSPSQEAPIKSGNFSEKNQAFAEASADGRKYSDWKFIHSPLGPSPAADKPAAK
jgi:type II secretory pathway pseudopilin PulG